MIVETIPYKNICSCSKYFNIAIRSITKIYIKRQVKDSSSLLNCHCILNRGWNFFPFHSFDDNNERIFATPSFRSMVKGPTSEFKVVYLTHGHDSFLFIADSENIFTFYLNFTILIYLVYSVKTVEATSNAVTLTAFIKETENRSIFIAFKFDIKISYR